ncbi:MULTISPECIES: hypothetical protein [Pandoraea]|uniref:SLOG domain-containing protein n=1 Tax=Pandoraea TaxID=93217 RepID=UPI002413EC33|nr:MULTISPECIES: hypothetical protein [Pandoraea]MCI3203859.1 hypothetical protein [Pandoraea sp. LA3]MDN4581885.1 hypothetical protein [Pandoraea capi]
MGAIFLSASVPVRPPYDADARPQEIQAAVSALAQVTLGRKKLVWGGHPAITPLLWAAAQAVGVEYAAVVELFQSRLYEDDFPDENKHFANVTYVDAVDGDKVKSLAAMRTAMLTSCEFEAAVFIGGMDGVNQEYEMFVTKWPNAACIPLALTGGATRELAQRIGYAPGVDAAPLDFVALLYHELRIRPREKREYKKAT